MKPLHSKRIHLIAPFHTVPSPKFTSCAFTQKAVRFSKMMQHEGFEVMEYANAGSDSEAEWKWEMLSKEEYNTHFPPLGPTESWGERAKIGGPGWQLFHSRLKERLKLKLDSRDIIAHVFCESHASLLEEFPDALHVETGIGYPNPPFGAWRIFESETWRHWHWGKYDGMSGDGMNKHFSYVIPNYFDVTEWKFGKRVTTPPYVMYMARLASTKGIQAYGQICKRWHDTHPGSNLKFLAAGQGGGEDVELAIAHAGDAAEHFIILPPVPADRRSDVLGGATALLSPTLFIEPFGGAAIEAMLCGTQAIATDWGAYIETLKPEWRCKIIRDWMPAIERALALTDYDRRLIKWEAEEKYSLETCGKKYTRAFNELSQVKWGEGYLAQ